MFDYTWAHWATFFSAAVLLNIAPGPDLAFILGQTLKHGRKSGFVAMFGIWTGAFFHVLLAAIGLSVILATSALAFNLVKWLGAAYLVWLGWQALRAGAEKFVDESGGQARSHTSIFMQGMLVAALNPKVAIFFLAFLPQFVEAGKGSVSAQLMLHGTLIIAVAAVIEPLFLLASEQMLKRLDKNPRVSQWIDRSLGVFFIAIGIRLALSER